MCILFHRKDTVFWLLVSFHGVKIRTLAVAPEHLKEIPPNLPQMIVGWLGIALPKLRPNINRNSGYNS